MSPRGKWNLVLSNGEIWDRGEYFVISKRSLANYMISWYAKKKFNGYGKIEIGVLPEKEGGLCSSYNFSPLKSSLMWQKYMNYQRTLVGKCVTRSPQVPVNIFLEDKKYSLRWVFQHCRVGALAPKNVCVCSHNLIHSATTYALHVVHYSSQNCAIHILAHMNGTFLWKALHTEWVIVAAQSESYLS